MSRRRPGGAVLVGLFLAASAVAQPSAPDTVWVQPEVEPAVVSIGEPVDVRVRLVAPGAQVELIGPPAPMSAGDLDILLSQPVPAGGDSLAWDLRVALFRPGDHTLETIPFVLDTPEGSRPLRLVPYRITVESVLSDSAGASDLRDIHDRVEVPRRWRWDRVALAAAALLALVGVGLWWWRRPRGGAVIPAEPRLSPEQEAYLALRELEEAALPERGHTKEHYARLSLLLRIYGERRFGLPLAESTTDEMRALFERHPDAAGALADAVLDLCTRSDLVKFARQDPGRDTARADLGKAREWLDSAAARYARRSGDGEKS